MNKRTKAERDFDLQCGREIERKDSEIIWYKSALVSLLNLAEREEPLTKAHVAAICKVTLNKYEGD